MNNTPLIVYGCGAVVTYLATLVLYCLGVWRKYIYQEDISILITICVMFWPIMISMAFIMGLHHVLFKIFAPPVKMEQINSNNNYLHDATQELDEFLDTGN